MVKRREQDIYRKTMENSDLICDLNDLRKANKKLESEVYNTEKEKEHLEKRIEVLEEKFRKYEEKGKSGRHTDEGGMSQQNFYPVQASQNLMQTSLYKPK